MSSIGQTCLSLRCPESHLLRCCDLDQRPPPRFQWPSPYRCQRYPFQLHLKNTHCVVTNKKSRRAVVYLNCFAILLPKTAAIFYLTCIHLSLTFENIFVVTMLIIVPVVCQYSLVRTAMNKAKAATFRCCQCFSNWRLLLSKVKRLKRKQGKKVCKTTVVQCYQCFSLSLLLFYASRVKLLPQEELCW